MLARKVYLFDHEGLPIKEFDRMGECASFIGVPTTAVRAGVKRGGFIHGKYYASYSKSINKKLDRKYSNNFLLKTESAFTRYFGAADFRAISKDEYDGLLLLRAGVNFDNYIFGNTPIKAQQADSFFPKERML